MSWFALQLRAARQGAARLTRTPFASLLAALVIGVTLALPASGHLLLAGLSAARERISAAPELSVFLAPGAAREAADELGARLRKHPGLAKVDFVAREQTLERFSRDEGLAPVLASLPRNPFPDAFVLVPRAADAAAVEALRRELAALPAVEHLQVDSEWVQRLEATLRAVRRAGLGLAALLAVMVVAVAFNTIRLQMLSHRAEIELARLLGATDAWIRRPFLWFGALQGLAGGLVAWGIAAGIAWVVAPSAAELAQLWRLDLRAPLPDAAEVAALLSASVLLGWIGARLSAARHLRETDPS